MKRIAAAILTCTGLLIAISSHCQSIKKYSESASNFNNAPELNTNTYPDSVMYRAYKKGKTGASSLSKLQTQTENKIKDFAKKQNKSFVILGQRISNPPYLLGNYPRIEIVFALIDKIKP